MVVVVIVMRPGPGPTSYLVLLSIAIQHSSRGGNQQLGQPGQTLVSSHNKTQYAANIKYCKYCRVLHDRDSCTLALETAGLGWVATHGPLSSDTISGHQEISRAQQQAVHNHSADPGILMGSPGTAANCAQSRRGSQQLLQHSHNATTTTAAPQHLGDQQRGAPTSTPQHSTTPAWIQQQQQSAVFVHFVPEVCFTLTILTKTAEKIM